MAGPSASLHGLSQSQAQARLTAEGYNELPRSEQRTLVRIILEVLSEPMLLLLLAGGAIYLVLGDLKEALILLAFANLSVLIAVVQETRTERVLEALRDLSSPRALVVRDGVRVRIAGREVVRGDIVILAEGDRVPADAMLVIATDLQIDESLLTGESVPVRKLTGSGAAASLSDRPGGDDLPYVFSGSLIVRGTGVAEVTATGARSEIGKIGQSLSEVEREAPRLQTQTGALVRAFAIVGSAVAVLAVLLYGLLRGGWLDAALAGIALGMSMMPEELPIVLTVFVTMGAWRISQARVLTRRAAAIETLGAATVLCTDKTGTLTENRMSIAELRLSSGEVWRSLRADGAQLPEGFQDVARTGLLACVPDPFDPMEKAFHDLAGKQLAGAGYPGSQALRLAHSYGLRPGLLAMAQVWQEASGTREFLVAAKGAPEAIADLCHLSAADRDALMQSVNAMADEGLRVLGIARASFAGETLPDSQHDFQFTFLGLAGLADPIRPSVPKAMKECLSAGVKVIMITGDYPATARAIARQAGLEAGKTVSGEELDRLGDAELAECIGSVTVFARIMPEQKLRIVNALKANGEIVAMTGDGVNDAPSLKAAHIGIAMGGRGTDVAREAASIILLDDDFGSIVKALRLGRRIYDNLRKATVFIFAVHVPIAGLSLLPLLSGLPILFWPAHIAFLEMVIDPVCSLVFEAEREEDDVMRRPPRSPQAPLFPKALIVWGLLQGTLAFAAAAFVFLTATLRGMPETEVRALTFFALVITMVSLILVNRSFSASIALAFRRFNPALFIVIVAVTMALGLTLLWPWASDLFRFGPLHLNDLAVAFVPGLLVFACLEILKPLWRKRLLIAG
jgi:P-type Ca2+ transporter type 2C